MPVARFDGKQFEQPRVGPHNAVCCMVEDVGLQREEWKGKPKTLHRVIIFWELEQRQSDGNFAGEPFLVSQKYTNSLGYTASLPKMLQMWMPTLDLTKEKRKAGIELNSLIGRGATITMVRRNPEDSDDNRTKVLTIGPMAPGAVKMTPRRTSPPDYVLEMRATSVQDRPDFPQDSTSAPVANGSPQNDDLPAQGSYGAPDQNPVVEDDLPF